MSKSGPNTAEGRAAVAQNATTHGIFSQAPVVQGVESQAEWEQHRQGVIASLSPVGPLEETLAERAALLLWRQARVARFEMYCIDRWQQEIEDDLKFRYQLEVGTMSPEARTNCSPQQIRTIHQQRQEFLLLLRRFPELADDAFLTYEEASRIGEAFLRQAGDQAELSLDGEPGEQPEDLPRVRVGTLREGLRQVAKQAGIHIAELWALTAQQAIQDAAWQQERAERLEGYFPVYHAYRVVPREEELQKVMRYEAHLSRELARLLKDFHTLQKSRRAAPAEAPQSHNCKTNPCPPPAAPQPPNARTPERLNPRTPEGPKAPTPSPAPAEDPEPHNCRTNCPPATSAPQPSQPSALSPQRAALSPQNCITNCPPLPPALGPVRAALDLQVSALGPQPSPASPNQDQPAGAEYSEAHDYKTNQPASSSAPSLESCAQCPQPSAFGTRQDQVAVTEYADAHNCITNAGSPLALCPVTPPARPLSPQLSAPRPQNCRTNGRSSKRRGRRM
jgi:hypothetical protein